VVAGQAEGGMGEKESKLISHRPLGHSQYRFIEICLYKFS
jgi:hypothetical protein